MAQELWPTKNDMAFLGMEITPIQVFYKIKYAYDGMWTPWDATINRTIKEPDIAHLNPWYSWMNLFKMKLS